MKYLNFAVFLGYKVLLKCSVKSIIMSYIPCEAVRKTSASLGYLLLQDKEMHG